MDIFSQEELNLEDNLFGSQFEDITNNDFSFFLAKDSLQFNTQAEIQKEEICISKKTSKSISENIHNSKVNSQLIEKDLECLSIRESEKVQNENSENWISEIIIPKHEILEPNSSPKFSVSKEIPINQSKKTVNPIPINQNSKKISKLSMPIFKKMEFKNPQPLLKKESSKQMNPIILPKPEMKTRDLKFPKLEIKPIFKPILEKKGNLITLESKPENLKIQSKSNFQKPQISFNSKLDFALTSKKQNLQMKMELKPSVAIDTSVKRNFSEFPESKYNFEEEILDIRIRQLEFASLFPFIKGS